MDMRTCGAGLQRKRLSSNSITGSPHGWWYPSVGLTCKKVPLTHSLVLWLRMIKSWKRVWRSVSWRGSSLGVLGPFLSRELLRWWLTLPSTVYVIDGAKNRLPRNVTGILYTVCVCVCVVLCVLHYCVPVDLGARLESLLFTSPSIYLSIWLCALIHSSRHDCILNGCPSVQLYSILLPVYLYSPLNHILSWMWRMRSRPRENLNHQRRDRERDREREREREREVTVEWWDPAKGTAASDHSPSC